jgi:hypothetical protein
MITTTFNNINSVRLEETIYSINKNLENNLIEKYFILLEVELTNEDEKLYHRIIDKNINLEGKIKDEFITLLKNEKTEIVFIRTRPTYRVIFNFCNSYRNIIWILSNSDIHFPIWNNDKLKLLLNIDYSKEFFALTRYNIYDELTIFVKNKYTGIIIEKNSIKYKTQNTDGSSMDSWIFKTPINIKNINLNFHLGKPECDGRMNFQLSKIRKVINPCLDIISIHKHTSWSEEPYNKILHEGKIISRQEYNWKLNKLGLLTKKIPFSNNDGKKLFSNKNGYFNLKKLKYFNYF